MTAPRTDPFEQNFPEVRVHIGARARRCLGLTHAGAVGAVRCGGGQGVESYLEYGAAFALAFSRRGTMLAAGRADGDALSRPEERIADDGVVNLRFKGVEEALL